MTLRIDKLGVVIAALLAYGAFVAPFANFRANRIVPGEARTILEALPSGLGAALLTFIAVALVVIVLKTPTLLRLVLGLAATLALALLIGLAARYLTPPENTYARVAPASGFGPPLTSSNKTGPYGPPWRRAIRSSKFRIAGHSRLASSKSA